MQLTGEWPGGDAAGYFGRSDTVRGRPLGRMDRDRIRQSIVHGLYGGSISLFLANSRGHRFSHALKHAEFDGTYAINYIKINFNFVLGSRRIVEMAAI